jgi:hypothetical protein
METTFPRLLLQHAAQRPGAAAMREKEYGIWQALSPGPTWRAWWSTWPAACTRPACSAASTWW